MAGPPYRVSIKMVNPFESSGSGSPVHGTRFVGKRRQAQRDRLLRSIIEPESSLETASVQIRGIARMGKTSLIQNAILDRIDDSRRRGIVTVSAKLGEYENAAEFFRDLVRLASEELDVVNALSVQLQMRAQDVETAERDLTAKVKGFFRQIKREGRRTILVLDEFDAAPRVFPTAASFQVLRDFPNDKTTYATDLVIVSRRPLSILEGRIDESSNLSMILAREDVRQMDEEETAELLGQLREVDVPVTPLMREMGQQLCGGHPYLLSAWGRQIANSQIESGTFDLETTVGIHGIRDTFNTYYDKLWGWLEDIGDAKKVMEILFGPQDSVTIQDAVRLQTYGLIREGISGRYTAFSEDWEQELRIRENQVAFFPLWTQTEELVRSLIQEKMEIEFEASDWFKAYAAKHPSAAETWEKADSNRQKAYRHFGALASTNLLDYLDWSELWPLLGKYWPRYEPVLGKKSEWSSVWSDVLGAIRNPMFHSRNRDVVGTEIYRQAEFHLGRLHRLLRNRQPENDRQDGEA